jgi:hypothetical protein
VASDAAVPVASTGGATSVTSTTAVLNGFVAPTQPSAWLFQYGLTKSYGTNTKPQYVAAGSAVPVSWQITGLTPNTLYHYRLVVIEGTYSQPRRPGRSRRRGQRTPRLR